MVPSPLREGVLKLEFEGIGEAIDPNLDAKVSTFGDRALGSYVMVERTVRAVRSIPRASSVSSGIGVGGVGVRGGAGMGRLDAIAAVKCTQGSMRRSAEIAGRLLKL